MDCNNVTLRNFIYQGGDDCIAIKPRSYNIDVKNVTCRGGNGIAIGSLGQYLEDSSVENVTVSDVKVINLFVHIFRTHFYELTSIDRSRVDYKIQ